MATIICMDGLAGHPETMFGELKLALEKSGHRVVLADVAGIKTHEDRIQRVMNEYYATQYVFSKHKIFLIGQSAGGSAVRIAAERLAGDREQVAGVTLLSPAMPRGIFFLTPTLTKTMGGRWRELLLAQDIMPTEAEFRALLYPVSGEEFAKMFANCPPIAGKEARHLAFLPDQFQGYDFPTLHIWGDQDRWIAPSAQEKLVKKLRFAGSFTTKHIVEGAGHLTLASDRREEVMGVIQKWIEVR